MDPDQECRDYLVCTPEQDCRVWGNNCNLVQPPVTSAPEASQGGSESGASENSASENSGSENSGSDNGGSQGSGSNGGSQTGQLECATLADPSDSSINPDSYDWSC